MGCGSSKPQVAEMPSRPASLEKLFEKRHSLVFDKAATRDWYKLRHSHNQHNHYTVRSKDAKIIPLNLEQRRLVLDIWENRIHDKHLFCVLSFRRIFQKLPTLTPFFSQADYFQELDYDSDDMSSVVHSKYTGTGLNFGIVGFGHADNFCRFLEVIFAALSNFEGEKSIFEICDYVGRQHVKYLKAVRLTKETWIMFANCILEVSKEFMTTMEVRDYVKGVEAWNLLLQFISSLVRTSFIGALEATNIHSLNSTKLVEQF